MQVTGCAPAEHQQSSTVQALGCLSLKEQEAVALSNSVLANKLSNAHTFPGSGSSSKSDNHAHIKNVLQRDSHPGAGDGLGMDGAPVMDTPSRLLLVHGVKNEMPDTELAALFAAHGEVRQLDTSQKALGIAVVVYYDLRAAIQAYEHLNGADAQGQSLQLWYMAPVQHAGEGLESGVNQVCCCALHAWLL